MIDLHAHILPGTDDGPDEWDKAVKMLNRASEDGIVGIVATPHVRPGVYDNPCELILSLTEELRDKAKSLPIEIYPGSELMLSPEILSGLKDKKYCTINSSRYVLIELPNLFSTDTVYDFIFSLTSRGFVPVIAHPERNPRIMSDMGTLYEMVRLGALTQVTSASFTGLFGKDVKKAAVDIVTRRLAHVLASDAHTDGRRAPLLSAGLAEVKRLIGGQAGMAMVRDHPKMIINDTPFEVAEPLYTRKKKFFFF